MKLFKQSILAISLLGISILAFAGPAVSVTNTSSEILILTIGCSSEDAMRGLTQIPIYPGRTDSNVNLINCASTGTFSIAVYGSLPGAYIDKARLVCSSVDFPHDSSKRSLVIHKQGTCTQQ